MISEKKLAQLLVEEKLLTDEQLQKALESQAKGKNSLKDTLIRLNLVDEDDIIATLVSKLDFSYIRLKNYSIDRQSLRYVPKDRCVQYKLIPIAIEEKLLTVAMANPMDIMALDDIKMRSGMEVFPVIAKESEIIEALSRFYTSEDESIRAISEKVDSKYSSDELRQLEKMEGAADKDSALIVQLTNRVIENAFYAGASDIHVEPFENGGIVRYRVDGVLREALRLPKKAMPPLIARLKIMASIDISEHRLPLDGRIRYGEHNRQNLNFDLRVSSIPTAFGEKMCMRILDHSSVQVDIEKMGYSAHNLERYLAQIKKPYGMALHCGPTGSGKTTALYAALAHISTPEKNIQTAEDPIEYNLPGINQCQIRADIGFNFARALRAFLRQDPNVIMIGEIRDAETGEIAIEAALTGHMVFSTMHTNDASTTVARLLEMGIEPFLVSSAIVCVVAQRLARTLCRCKQGRAASADELKRMGIAGSVAPMLFRPVGCKKCNGGGYKGRMGVHEALVMDDELRTLVIERAPAHEINKVAVKNGMVPMYQDGVEKILHGRTSLEELLRVIR